ncbi:MAG TPA: type II toxin-antitoxin system VapC family toxin [Candidatus Acidoferrum sp.]|nr:type II toxin-antitoxin system VapC family toxin [Candidatus Acidoferrum sp.]
MKYLLDTNVVSELVKLAPDAGVVQFLAEADDSAAALSVITLAELRYGIERLAPGAKREGLTRWLEDELPRRFFGRILQVDDVAAAEWGRTMARAERAGRPMSEMDAWLAALASVYHLVLVTRNVGDFSGTGIETFSPWRE